ncbi:hypothetical protein [Pseudoroseicyclus aestuarii]|uniref:Uncharacterized protein n=1 Tax=Pseudoroseicyclus aestuarii TaxID=1795041 RepID=A0A318SMP5_9RHOB|nr:hypothetical protein [Pseudoroseicyclus aestuarii]PYE81213.1 hypothetical protein DFP88_1072 [Pseudoroseicyclus aestuarii]
MDVISAQAQGEHYLLVVQTGEGRSGVSVARSEVDQHLAEATTEAMPLPEFLSSDPAFQGALDSLFSGGASRPDQFTTLKREAL